MARQGKVETTVPLELLPNEEVNFVEVKQKRTATDEELNSRYAKGEVRIVTESARYSLAGIPAMLNEYVDVDPENEESIPPSGIAKELRYKLDPEYQRRHRWSDERKSRLIESFLMNVPVPPVFLYERDLARFEVMDGRQRLTALSDFYANKFSLCGLEYWPDLDGRRYCDLPKKVRDGIDRRYISSIILLKETASTEEKAAELKKIVFERLNSGGVELGSQETRNAIYDGPLNKLCLKLSNNEKYKEMWGIPANPTADYSSEEELLAENDVATVIGKRMFEKMEDVEMILRFFAYRQIKEFRAGLNKISEFLDKFLVKGNGFDAAVINDYEVVFNDTISFLYSVLGVEAFHLIGVNDRPTKIVYDPIMFVSNAEGIACHRKALEAHPDFLRESLAKSYSEHRTIFAGRKTNYADTQLRNHIVYKAFVEAIAKI